MAKLTEEDIKNRFITPAIESSGWAKEQTFMEYSFTDGQVMVRGNVVKRGPRKKADYILAYDKNLPLAIVEAKDNEHSIGDGMQQALAYAEVLDIPFVYSTNGTKFLEHDRYTGIEIEINLNNFPTPQQLWQRYCKYKNYNEQQQQLILEPYYFDTISKKSPRYYQRIAINKTIDAIANGQNRILLVMATGTGKTYTAFQIIHRLIKAGTKKKILYLADRNILIDQTMQQDFKPFKKIMTKIKGKKLDSSYEIYMSLYQQLAGDDKIEPFRKFKPEFFDLIIVDECHRGSAKDESRWRKILEYFNNATQIGMTATPKETKEVSNITYFGEPVYTYSLKQGIDDGFLAPYKVIRIGIDKDLEGWRPYMGQTDVDGNIIEDREYNARDYDRNLIIDERTKLVANRITKWLKANDRYAKTIIFCVDIEHAERMRQAMINENTDLVKENSKYIMRITGDNDEGKKQLDYFIDLESKYPTIVTTSRLMTTGVDCKTCKLIVLDNVINSMTEFKQIIGRGTRLEPKYGKEYFTILDFRDACRLFSDPDFDGEPVVIKDVGDGGEGWEPSEDADNPNNDNIPQNPETENPPEGEQWNPPDGENPIIKKIHVNGIEIKILNERVQYYDQNGKLITESLRDYSKKNILNQYATLDVFLSAWSKTDKKTAIIKELEARGVILEALKNEAGKKDLDDFDLICHIA
ncbi:MAG: DEAD/DEAH box helicase family protein, partial [Eubacteriaceae bacterium]